MGIKARPADLLTEDVYCTIVGGAVEVRPLFTVALRGVRALIQHGVDQLQLAPSEHIQLDDAGQRGFEPLSDADPLASRPQRVHAASAPRHPERAVRVRTGAITAR